MQMRTEGHPDPLIHFVHSANSITAADFPYMQSVIVSDCYIQSPEEICERSSAMMISIGLE